MSAIREAQDRAIDDARVRWHDAIAALDTALKEAENLHDASPQLLVDESYWDFHAAHDGMTTLLTDLIDEVSA